MVLEGHVGRVTAVDLLQVTTAVSAHPWARPHSATARPDGLSRLVGTLHEPNAWTVGVLLATGVVLMARHPIARALGTETPVAPVVATEAPAQPHSVSQAPSLALPVVAAPTHAPRDPFRALVGSGGKVLAPAEPSTGNHATSATVTPVAATPTSCAGSTHRVVAGDTLWTLAARAVRSSDTDRVTFAWHRLYADNRAVIGSDPAVLHVGDTLCVPQSL